MVIDRASIIIGMAAIAVVGFSIVVKTRSPEHRPRVLMFVVGAMLVGYVSVIATVGAWAARCPSCHSGSETSEFARRDVLVVWALTLGTPVLVTLTTAGAGVWTASLLRDRAKPRAAEDE